MKRFQSAFAVPSGFAVAANAKTAAKVSRRKEAMSRAPDIAGPAAPTKRAARDICDRAA